MKYFLNFVLAIMVLGVFSSCKDDELSSDMLKNDTPKTSVELIESELAKYSNDESVDIALVRKSLLAFNEALLEAKNNQMIDADKIGGLFVSKALLSGIKVYENSQIETVDFGAKAKIPSIPSELLKALSGLVQTVEADSIDEYINNLDAYYNEIKGSELSAIAKMGILGSVITLKIIAKIVKLFNPNFSADVKWKKQLKCAFKSMASGLAGALTGCAEGASIVGGIGSLGGTQGKLIGSLVGCTVGAVIQGIINIVDTAQNCVKVEGLKE